MSPNRVSRKCKVDVKLQQTDATNRSNTGKTKGAKIIAFKREISI